MRKVLYTLSTAAIMLGGLTACNTNNQGALDTNYKDGARPIGYYSNEGNDDGNNRNGNGYRVTDNDGPLTEIMDRNTNDYNKNNGRNTGRNNGAGIMNTRDGNQRGGTPYNDGNPNTMRDNGHGQADTNYHSHLNDNNHRVQTYGYYGQENGRLVQKIADRASKVQNVDDARVIVTDDNVLVAVDTDDNNDKRVREAVIKAVKPLTKGKNLTVVTDEATFTRVRDIDSDIRNGDTPDSVDADIRDLFDNIGDAITRPFTKNNR